MKSSVRCRFASLAAVLLVAAAAWAQVPDKFTNLKVFPKDIGKQELIHAMRGISDALGVSCTHCHVEKVPGDHRSIDWASDDLDPKKVARGMMKMVGAINGDLLPAATGKHDATVSCVTCHRGLANPATLDQVMLATIDKDGIDAAVAKYRELRDQYYGSGSYDFSPASLGDVAETLAQGRGDLAGATRFVDLNVEMNPKDPQVYVMRAQIQLAGGDKAAARASAQQALDLDPQSRAAQHLIQQLDQGQ